MKHPQVMFLKSSWVALSLLSSRSSGFVALVPKNAVNSFTREKAPSCSLLNIQLGSSLAAHTRRRPRVESKIASTVNGNDIKEIENSKKMMDNGEENIEVNDTMQSTWLKESMANVDLDAVINIMLVVGVALFALNKLATVDEGLMRGWTAAEMAVRIPVDNWNSYESVLEAAPISTKAVTSATVYSIGDIIAQQAEGKSLSELDRMRNLRSLLAGLIGHGPMSHVWYNWSENIFSNVLGLHDQWWAFFPKVAIDQTTWGPFWNNTYILLLGIMQWRNPKAIFQEMKETTIPLIVSGLKLWPLAHSITYGVIPVENRLLWVDLVEIIWVTILATAANGAGGHGAPAAKDLEEDAATEAKA